MNLTLPLTPYGELCKLENEIGAQEILRRVSGWIKLSERKPTEEDADENGNVLWRNRKTKVILTAMYHNLCNWEEWDYWLSLPKFTEEKDKDEAAFKQWRSIGYRGDAEDEALLRAGWNAALEYARNNK